LKYVLIIQNCETESPGAILNYLDDKDIKYQIVKSYELPDYPPIEYLRAIINLGCPISTNDYHQHEFLKNVYGFLSEVVRGDIPYLGICFGGQVLAKIHGAKVEFNGIKEIGTYEIMLTEDGKNDPLFDGFPDKFPAFQWHSDRFRIPFGGTHLAFTEDCKYQAFRKDKFVGLQFHFEAVPEEIPMWCEKYADELIEVGKDPDEIISAYKSNFEIVKKLNYKFMDNFFKLLK
jgi:GMP synthase-like glutamine amidotransferase